VGVVVLCTLTGLCRTIGGAIAVQLRDGGADGAIQPTAGSRSGLGRGDHHRRAGIDPKDCHGSSETVLAQRAEQPTPLEAFFASHPTDEARIAALRREIAALGPSPGAPLIRDTPEFQAFRDRVRALPPPPPPYDTLGAPKRPH
jgi:hypothetical protein